jgi:hypothetical protein
MFIFFSIGNPKRTNKFGNKPVQANRDEVNKKKKTLNSLKNKVVSSSNLQKLTDYIVTVSNSNNNWKLGNILATTIKACNLLVNDEAKQLLTSSSKTTKQELDNTKVYRTNLLIGSSYSRQVRCHKSGPTYEVFNKRLYDSKTDSIAPKKRRHLHSTHGLNQRCFCFMGSETYLSIRNLKALSNYFEDHQEAILNDFGNTIKNITELMTVPEVTRDDDEDDSPKRNNRKVTRHHAALMNTRLTLRVTNEFPIYDANVKIHLVRFNSASLCTNRSTINKLLNDVQYKPGSNKNFIQERVFPDDVLNITNHSTVSTQLLTTLNVNLTRLESFKNSCKILKTFTRKLSSGSSWIFSLEERYRNGVYLNKLLEYDLRKIDESTPISLFLIVEHVGDHRCQVVRKSDQENFPFEKSPGSIHFDIKMNIQYLANPDTEEILIMKQKVHDDNFQDETLADHFYPDRETTPFNVDLKNIDRPGRHTKTAEYQLQTSNMSLNSSDEHESLIDSLISRIGKISPNIAKDLVPEDLPFMSYENDPDEEEEENNIDGDNDFEDLDI